MSKKHIKGLPIYQEGNNLVKLVLKSTKEFSKGMRPLLGRMMLEESMQIIRHIIRANTERDIKEKVRRIERILIGIESIDLLWQSAFEYKLINSAVLASSIEITESLSNQAGGWKRHFERQLKTTEPG